VDGTGHFVQTNGSASAGGIVLDSRAASPGTHRFVLEGGSFYLTATNGISSANPDVAVLLGGGTLGASNHWGSSLPMSLTGTNGHTTLDVTGTSMVTLDGVLSGTGGMVKAGTGLLTLNAVNTYGGDTLVSDGDLRVQGVLDASGSTEVGAAGTLLGTGTVNTVDLDGTLEPGTDTNTVGILSAAGGDLNGGAVYVWHAEDLAASGGLHDRLNASGLLNANGTAGNPVTIKVVSLTAPGVPGLTSNFDNTADAQWPVVTASSVLVADPAGFVVDDSDFVNPLDGGSFSVTSDTVSVYLKFTPPPQVGGTSTVTSVSLAGTNGFRFGLSVEVGKQYSVEATEDLLSGVWTNLSTFTSTNAAVFFNDPSYTGFPNRAYRLNSP
jgi:autotransporter-associated beta strand protein